MNRLRSFLLGSAALTALAATSALAASSGNFSATVDKDNCTINSSTGALNVPAGQVFPITFNPISVQISSGSGTALVVTPSAVTGLFTDNKITNSTSTSTEDVGIQVQVTVTPTGNTVVAPGAIQIAPNTPGDSGNTGATGDTGATCALTSAQKAANAVTSCVIYDQRFIQINSQTLAGLVSGSTVAFELVESTLAAHAFNFYVQAPGGTYEFDVNAQLFTGNNNTAPASSVAGCFGPGTVTVVQVKNFSFDSQITF